MLQYKEEVAEGNIYSSVYFHCYELLPRVVPAVTFAAVSILGACCVIKVLIQYLSSIRFTFFFF